MTPHRLALIASAALLGTIPIAAAIANDGMRHGKDRMGSNQPLNRTDVEARVKERFASLDSNRDGVVVWEEVAAVRAARQAERGDAHFKAMDSDGNGQISRAEFDAAHAAGSSGSEHGERRGMRHSMRGERHGMGGGFMFHRADADKDGRVTLAEALKPALDRFDKADADRNGVLSPEERKAARDARRENGASVAAERSVGQESWAADSTFRFVPKSNHLSARPISAGAVMRLRIAVRIGESMQTIRNFLTPNDPSAPSMDVVMESAI